jgi:integrase
MRQTQRLNALKVRDLNTPGRHADGDGLYLQIDKDGSRYWIFMWKRGGKRRVMGLGSERKVSLSAARKKAKDAWRKVDDGIDPIAERKGSRAVILNFGQAAIECHATLSKGWDSAKHKTQWLPFVEKYAKPLYRKPVNQIDTDDVVRVLSPYWKARPDLAMRIRERIQRVLNWAEAKGMRHGKNPASWRGNLQDWMAKPAPKHTRVEHMRALHYNKIPDFMARLRATETGVGARALEFTILCAARHGETTGATWDEFFQDGQWTGLWRIPAHRMKMRLPHVVPLSERALQIVKDQYEIRRSRLVFPGRWDDSKLANTSMLNVVRRLGENVTTHGFRSTFRDWAGDLMGTRFPRDVIEMALAHTVGDATERAYRRGNALEQRRELMDAWAAYCDRPPQADNVIPMERIKPIPA